MPSGLLASSCMSKMQSSTQKTYRDAVQAHVEVGVAIALQVVIDGVQQRHTGGAIKQLHRGVCHRDLHSSCGVAAAVSHRREVTDVLILHHP